MFLLGFGVCLHCLSSNLNCRSTYFILQSMSESVEGWDLVGSGITCPLLGVLVMAFDPKHVAYLCDLKCYELSNTQRSYQELNAVSIFLYDTAVFCCFMSWAEKLWSVQALPWWNPPTALVFCLPNPYICLNSELLIVMLRAYTGWSSVSRSAG